MKVGSKVTATTKAGKVSGTVKTVSKGWITIETKDGDVKARAKDVKAKVEKTGDSLIEADLSRYTIHESTTATGRKHVDIDDKVAEKLREMPLAEIYRYAAQVLECTIKELHDRYDSLNPGMQRMNLGNRIRGVFNLAEKAKTGFSKHKNAA